MSDDALTPEELAEIERAWRDLFCLRTWANDEIGSFKGPPSDAEFMPERPDINDPDAIHLAGFRFAMRKWQGELAGLNALDALLLLDHINVTLCEIWQHHSLSDYQPWHEWVEFRIMADSRLQERMMHGIDEDGVEVIVGC